MIHLVGEQLSMNAHQKIILLAISGQYIHPKPWPTASANAPVSKGFFIVATAMPSVYLTAPRPDLYPITLVFLQMQTIIPFV